MCFACNTYVKNHFCIQHFLRAKKDEANDYNSYACVRAFSCLFLGSFVESHTLSELDNGMIEHLNIYLTCVSLFELRSLAVCNMGAFATIHKLIAAWRFLIDWISEEKMNKSLTCPLHQSSPSMYQLGIAITFVHSKTHIHIKNQCDLFFQWQATKLKLKHLSM